MRAVGSARLILICGLPGSGKTTLARTIESAHDAVRLCPDEWLLALDINLHAEPARARIEALQWTFAQRLLALGNLVILEWGTWGRAERDTLRTGARALGAAVELHLLLAPPEVLFARIRARAAEDPPITRESVALWSTLFETPTAEERALFDPALPMPKTALKP